MNGPNKEHSTNTAIYSSVLAAGFAASMAGPGAIYCLEKVAPDQMDWLKKLFCRVVVQPHLPLFEKLSINIRHARDRYDERQRAKLRAAGIQVPEAGEKENAEFKAYAIADAWVTTALALGVDFSSQYLLLKALNRMPGVENKSGKIAIADGGATLVGLLLMPTLLARPAEYINHTMSKILRRFGMSKEGAENISVPATYVGVPSMGATLVSLIAAKMSNGIHK